MKRAAGERLPALSLVWGIAAATCLGWTALAGRGGEHMALVMAAIALAAAISALAGFAFSAICGAMLFQIDSDPTRIVTIMIACSIANQAAMVCALRREINWSGLGIHLAAGMPGLAVGLWILLNMDRSIYVRGFGAFLVVYGAIMLARRPAQSCRDNLPANLLAGFLGGITGGGAGFPGAFVTVWCGMKGWSKAQQRALVQPFILVMQVAALAALSVVARGGAVGHSFDYKLLLFIPASLAGTSLGVAMCRRLTDRQFGVIVNLLLLCSGVSYIF